MVFGDPAAYRHLQPARAGDEIENGSFRHLELACELVNVVRAGLEAGCRCDGSPRADHAAVLSDECSVPLVLATRVPLETDEIQKRRHCPTYDHLYGLFGAASPLALTPRPASREDLFNEGCFELERNEVLGRTVQDRIEPDEEALARINADEKRGVQAVGILPQMMDIVALFAAVLQLKTIFVAGTVSGQPPIGKKRVDDDPHSFGG